MKTTIDIADNLVKQAQALAAREEKTFRALVEEGLTRVLKSRHGNKVPAFKLRDASVKGKGLQPGAENLSWEKMRNLIYGDSSE